MPSAATNATIRRKAIWFGLLGGAAAWTVHLMSAYVVAEFGCLTWLAHKHYAGIVLVSWIEIGLTAVTTLVAAAATGIALATYGRLRGQPVGVTTHTAELHAAWAGVLTSGIFTLVIVFESIPILYYLQRC